MTPENQAKLLDAYPLIFNREPGRRRPTDMCVGDGWFNLIETACLLSYEPFRQATATYERIRVKEGKPVSSYGPESALVTAADVECARLAMTAAEAEVPRAVQVKQKFGTLRFYVDRAGPVARGHILFAEVMSGRTCEVCGAVGHPAQSSWIRTLCATHEKERVDAAAAEMLLPCAKADLQEGWVSGESGFVDAPAPSPAPPALSNDMSEAVRLLNAEVVRLKGQVARLVSSNEHTAIFSQH